MNINKEQIDDLNITVSVGIGKDDYESKVNEVLRDYRRKANMPGFRPGKVPEGLIRKMYGKAVLVDEINKLVSESLQNYINEEKLSVLGDPLPKLNDDQLEWEIGNDYTFDFEMGLAPNVKVDLSKKDKIDKYQIIVDKELIDKHKENYSARFGTFVDTDTVVDFKERLTGDIVRLNEDKQPVEDDLAAENSTVLLSLIKDEELKKPFENAKIGDEIVFNLSETFPNDWEIASILQKKKKEDVGDIDGSLFRFTVKSVQKFQNAELNTELFDKIFGEGTVSTIEEFEERIKEDIAKDFEENGMAKFGYDAREYLSKRIDPALPEEFLRKWLRIANKDIDNESFDREFPAFLKSMKWDLISQSIAKENDFKVEEQDIIDYAKDVAKRQFAQYGMTNVPDETLTNYALGTLKDEKNVRRFIGQIIEKKVVEVIHEAVDTSIKEIGLDDFNKMIYAEHDRENADQQTEE